jgi:hypothetical protein
LEHIAFTSIIGWKLPAIILHSNFRSSECAIDRVKLNEN